MATEIQGGNKPANSVRFPRPARLAVDPESEAARVTQYDTQGRPLGTLEAPMPVADRTQQQIQIDTNRLLARLIYAAGIPLDDDLTGYLE